jgi:hypothetical protein
MHIGLEYIEIGKLETITVKKLSEEGHHKFKVRLCA